MEGGERMKQRWSLETIVRGVLMVGIGASVVLLLIGLGLDEVKHNPLPERVVSSGDLIHQIMALQPEGFLSLGLITLMGTPLAGVVAAIFVFLWQREWLYAGVTTFVLLVISASAFLGQG